MNQIKTEKVQYDATRQEYEYAVVEEENFNAEMVRKQLERNLEVFSSNAAFYCRLTSEYLALEPERSNPPFLQRISELTEQLQDVMDEAYHVVLQESMKTNQVRK
ncbi:MAG: hypothetical protein IPI28_03395 [Candidatus Omnitrophica bacterium]|nr:hypothetical protein [Candidatus Omnitrophota bacterium]